MKNSFKKFRIPSFVKTKKFFLLAGVFLVFFLFTPISLHQISKKVEDFINHQAVEGVQQFEKQTGLKIEWKKLKFNILTMTVKLEGVQLQAFNNLNSQKIQAFDFLDGLQKVETVSAKPSLYSLLFEKQIVLSKLQISEGDIYLRTLKSFLKKTNTSQTMDLPIKQILIKKTNLNLRHQEHRLSFSKVSSTVRQKTGGVFHFDLFVEKFRISKNLGFKEFQALSPYMQNKKSLEQKNENEVFQLALKGQVQKDKVFFEKINLKNKNFQSATDWLDIHFDSKGLKMGIKSSGTLPFSLINKGLALMGREWLPFDSFLSYKLNIQYRKNKGYQGFFEVTGEDAVFKSTLLKNFSLKGRLINYILAVDQGSIESSTQGKINIKKGEWFFKREPFQFHFSIETDKLSSDFVIQPVLNLNEFPIKGDFTGSIDCFGVAGLDSHLKCETQGRSERIRIQLTNEDEIVSFYEMNFNSDIEWGKKVFNFTVNSVKTDFSQFHLKGRYSQPLDKLSASYSFFGDLYKDLKFNVPFPIEGEIKAQEGRLLIEKGKVQLNGFFISSLLKLQSYRLKNISGFYKLENKKLKFFNIRGTPDKTNYIAECDIDFDKEELVLKSEFSFFDVEDFLEAIQEKNSWPVKFKGTGTVSFFINFPWSLPDQKKLQFKGNLFNVSINKDFFQQIAFDLGIQNQQGLVRSLSFKKGQGFIKGTGVFDKDFSLNLDLIGQNLSLERLEWLNEIIPFNQSGDVNFNMKLTGTPKNPRLNGNVLVSNMFFYSYPVNNSNIKLNLNKDSLSFTGNIMDEISIDKFIYPFSKNSDSLASGTFNNLDFIKILFSKNHIEKKQDYNSKITGSFSLSQNKKTQKTWEGFIKIDQFLISKYNKWVKNENPFSVFLNEKVWSFTPARFSHYNNKNLIIEKRGEDKLFLSGEASLGLFSVFFPFLEELDGNIKGQVLIDNNLRKLNPRGSLQIDEGLFSLGILPKFTNIKASLILSKSNTFINDFTSNAGHGLLEGEGTVFYNFVHLPRLNLNLKLSDAYLSIPEDVKTKGSGEIQIKGEKPPYLISGEYIIDSGNITKDFLKVAKKTKYNFSFLEEEIKKQSSIFELKLNIKTKQAVVVNSSLIRSSVEGQADIYGPLDSLLIDGQFVMSKKAEENLIFFRGQEFKISSGSILFKNSVPNNPYLNIQANTLFKENIVDPLSKQEIERNYKIFLSLKGNANNPTFSLESVPSLNEKEIISLLTLGLTLGVSSRYFDANVKQKFTDSKDYSYQLLGSLLLEKPLNREIKNTLGLDFRLTPYINTLNKPVTKITLSKNWFEKWKTSFSRTIEDDAQSDIRLKYDLNQKISLTAFWENTEQKKLENNQEDRLGLDFEFNFDF